MSAFHGSSAINKSSKKFAPKVARRRPAAVSGSEAASSTEQTPAGTPTASTAPALESTQADPQNDLPTPPATQAPTQAQPAPTAAVEQFSPPTAQPDSRDPTAAPHNDELEVGGRSPKRRRVELPASVPEISAQAEQLGPSGTAATPVPIASPQSQPAVGAVGGSNADTSRETASSTQDMPPQAPAVEGAPSTGEPSGAVSSAAQDSTGSASSSSAPKSKVTQPKAVKRRGAARLSNQDLIREVMGKNSGVTKPSTHAPTAEQNSADNESRPGTDSDNNQHEEQEAPQVDREAQTLDSEPAPDRAPKRAPNATAARRRRQPTEAPAEADQSVTEQQTGGAVASEAAGPTETTGTKKLRQPRPKKRAGAGSQQNTGKGSNVNAEAPKPKRVRKKPKTPATVVDADGETGADAGETDGPAEEQSAAPRKRPRNISDHLIFDEEDRENPEKTRIDASSMPMSGLTKDISMVGTISQREEALSKIDWDEEKRKRMEERERIAMGEEVAQTQAERDVALTRLQEAANNASAAAQAPQMRIVNGMMMLDHTSTQVDRNARAREDAEELQEIEEDELTTRVNQMSWIKANRKDPRERTSWGPTRADRWSDEQTDMFYDALKMFGTDFFIISKMFPGKTRANVKRKFVKEERLDPERIKRALIGESVPMDFEEYKRKTGKDDNFFRDPEELRQELEQETERQRQEVEEAQTRYAEQQRQRKLAKQGGADVEGEEGEGGKKGKKKSEGKRGKKGKVPIGGEDVEVIEFDGDELEHRR